MKVLWITNIVFPEAENKLTGGKLRSGSGGWLTSLANAIKEDVRLVVAAPSRRVSKLTKLEVNGIKHYILPFGKGNEKYNNEYEPIWHEIKGSEKPDLVHIHGTEYSHGLAYLRAYGPENVVVSIQGVMTEIAKHYLDGLSNKDIFSNLTLHDIFKTTLWGAKKQALERAKSELEILRMVGAVIGRTEFDHAHAVAMNPNMQYFHCDEVLREEFYTGQWKYENCTAHTIFVSSAQYPLKGFHMLLRALPMILKKFPDTKVMVAGGGAIRNGGFKDRISGTGYKQIICNLIRNNNLSANITYLGLLTAEEMKQQLLKANLFLCPSSNENSSNSVGEAQLLGVPCLASYVGGLPDMIPNKSCGELYNFFDIEDLAFKICRFFEESRTFDNSMMRIHAHNRHCKEDIVRNTINIYKKI